MTNPAEKTKASNDFKTAKSNQTKFEGLSASLDKAVTDMVAKHRQELDAEKKADKDAAEKKKKDDEFNAKALRVVTTYNNLAGEV